MCVCVFSFLFSSRVMREVKITSGLQSNTSETSFSFPLYSFWSMKEGRRKKKVSNFDPVFKTSQLLFVYILFISATCAPALPSLSPQLMPMLMLMYKLRLMLLVKESVLGYMKGRPSSLILNPTGNDSGMVRCLVRCT